MTADEAKRYVTPFLKRHPKLVWRRRFIFVPPIRHVIRFILIDNRSGRTRFSPRWGGVIACKPPFRLNLDWCHHLESHHGWNWDTEDSGVRERLFEQIETVALPGLAKIESLQDYFTFAEGPGPGKGFSYRPSPYVYLAAAIGDFAGARASCEPFLRDGYDWRKRQAFPELLEPILVDLHPLLVREDVSAIAALLRSYERASVSHFGLEDLYEPTPFPIEQ